MIDQMKQTTLITLITTLPTTTFGQAGPYNPSAYLQQQAADQVEEIYNLNGIELRISTEAIEGKRFARFQTETGALLVEKIDYSYLDEKGNSILTDCGHGEDKKVVEIEKPHLIRLQMAITESASFDVGFVQNLIINACNGTLKGYQPTGAPFEIGLSFKDNKNKTYQYYMQPLKSTLGFRTDF